MKRLTIVFLALLILVPAASAVSDYLTAYSSWVSVDAYLSAMDCTAPVELTPEEASIFRLGYACGYDSARAMYALYSLEGLDVVQTRTAIEPEDGQDVYIVNTETGKFHKAGCSAEKKILPEHRREIVATFDEVCQMGYSPCGICLRNPN